MKGRLCNICAAVAAQKESGVPLGDCVRPAEWDRFPPSCDNGRDIILGFSCTCINRACACSCMPPLGSGHAAHPPLAQGTALQTALPPLICYQPTPRCHLPAAA